MKFVAMMEMERNHLAIFATSAKAFLYCHQATVAFFAVAMREIWLSANAHTRVPSDLGLAS